MSSDVPHGLRRLAEAAAWYPRRLSAMAPRELIWHSRRAVQSLVTDRHASVAGELRSGTDWSDAFDSFRAATARPTFLDHGHAHRIATSHPDCVAGLLKAADAAADRSFQFFGYPAVSLPDPIDWNHDPLAALRWPPTRSSRINYRRSAADVKWIWELNRLQHLPVLAQAWLFTGDRRYSAAALDHLDSWITQNPPGQGIAWRGAFEIGLRSISVAIAVQGLRDAPELSAERFRRIATLLAESAPRCWRMRSLFSSANNHLIGEMAALAVIAMMLPDLRAATDWEHHAVRTLCVEADRQILPDGAGAEQSVSYQMFSVELLNLVAVLLRQRDGHPPAGIPAAIARSSSYLFHLVGAHDPDPRYGDDDDGVALRLSDRPVRTVREHLGIVAASGWFSPGPAGVHDSLDAAWMGAVSGRPPGRAEGDGVAETGSLIAPNGGLVVLHDGNRRTTMDIGPLGYLGIAAHGHADALSVTLSLDGRDVVSDPGTSSYYGHPGWRTALRGTRAHPTVCVDGQNQSVIGGAFLWSRHAQVRVHGVDLAAGIVDAEHDGYRRLPGDIVHRRWLIAPAGRRRVLVLDLISGDGVHSCVQTWPLHPELEAETDRNGHLISRNGAGILEIRYAATAPLIVEGVRGDEVSNLGWWSDRLETRTPAWWLSAGCQTALPVLMAALLSPWDDGRTHSLKTELTGGHAQATWREGDQTTTVTADIDGAATVRVHTYG